MNTKKKNYKSILKILWLTLAMVIFLASCGDNNEVKEYKRLKKKPSKKTQMSQKKNQQKPIDMSMLPPGHPPINSETIDKDTNSEFEEIPDMTNDPHGNSNNKTSNPFQWKTPEGWQLVKQKATASFGMQKIATFKIPGKDGQGVCTSTMMGGTGGGLYGVVNYWRNSALQIPGELGQKEIDKMVEKVKVADFDGYLVKLDSKDGKQIFVGIILPMGPNSLFIKFYGPTTTINAQYENFKTFYQTLKKTN